MRLGSRVVLSSLVSLSLPPCHTPSTCPAHATHTRHAHAPNMQRTCQPRNAGERLHGGEAARDAERVRGPERVAPQCHAHQDLAQSRLGERNRRRRRRRRRSSSSSTRATRFGDLQRSLLVTACFVWQRDSRATAAQNCSVRQQRPTTHAHTHSDRPAQQQQQQHHNHLFQSISNNIKRNKKRRPRSTWPGHPNSSTSHPYHRYRSRERRVAAAFGATALCVSSQCAGTWRRRPHRCCKHTNTSAQFAV
jgi:hypothetical protein